MGRFSAIILAAGQSTRFGNGESKMTALWRGEPLVRNVARAALASKVQNVLVVTGHKADIVASALTNLDLALVHNANFASGMASSLQAGMAGLPNNTDGVLILLGDMPQITPNLLNRLIDASATAPPEAHAIIPIYKGEWGNPVLLLPAIYTEIARLKGDQGARKLLQAAPHHIIQLMIEDESILMDVDTKQALEALKAKTL